MAFHFLFPAHPLRPNAVDPMFADQLVAARAAEFSASVCPDSAIQAGRPLRNVPAGATVVYRGWMLDADGYAALAAAITHAGATPLTSLAAYLAAHHLPRWYPLVADLTPETVVLPPSADPAAVLSSLGWGAFFVKDYVKSVKTAGGSIVRDAAGLARVAAELERTRGHVEGGLCVRRVEQYVPDAEQRYFVIAGQPFAADGGPVPDLVRQVAGRIPSPFFSADVARRTDGVNRLVEIGDGQVSDLVGRWTPAAFTALWAAGGR